MTRLEVVNEFVQTAHPLDLDSVWAEVDRELPVWNSNLHPVCLPEAAGR